MKVYVIDNGGQWTHREWRVLKYLKVDTKIVSNRTPFEEISDADGLVLSGGSPSVAADVSAMGNNGEYLDRADIPIMGICAGMQFICTHFGGAIGPGTVPEFGKVYLEISDHEDLFKDIPDMISVWASHNDEVKTIPKDFQITARSADCPVEAVRSLKRPVFGVQFHPEVEHTEHGSQIFENFLHIVKEWKG